MLKKLALWLFLAAIMPITAYASGPYYVSPASAPGGSPCANGSNSNNGLDESTPFLTVQKAIDTMTTGTATDIFLCPGRINGAIVTNKSGASTSGRIHIKSLDVDNRSIIDPYLGVGVTTERSFAHIGGAVWRDYCIICVTGTVSHWAVTDVILESSNPTVATLIAVDTSTTAGRNTWLSHLNEEPSAFGGLISINNTLTDFVVSNVDFRSISFAGGYIYDLWFHDNVAYDEIKSFEYFAYAYGTDWIVEDNEIYGYDTFIWHLNRSGLPEYAMDNGIFRRNSIHDLFRHWTLQPLDNNWQIGGVVEYITPAGNDNKIYNNTYYNLGYGTFPTTGGTTTRLNYDHDMLPDPTGNLVANNSYHKVSCDMYVFLPSGNEVANNLTGSHDTNHGTEDTSCGVNGGVAVNNNLFSVVASDTFVDPNTGDLRLLETSTAGGGGKDLSSTYTTDKNGETWTTWGRGAYASVDIEEPEDDPALLVKAFAHATNSAVTAAFDATNVHLFVVSAGAYEAGTMTVSDSSSNTWTCTSETEVIVSGKPKRNKVCYVINPTTTSSQTITVVATGQFPCVVVQGWDNIFGTYAFDTSTGTSASSSLTLGTGSITPSNADSLVVAGVTMNVAHSTTIDNGFTISSQDDWTCALAYKKLTASAATSATWTADSTANLAGHILDFIPAGDTNAVPAILAQMRRR